MNAFITLIFVLLLLSVSNKDNINSDTGNEVTFTIIYDNTSAEPDYEADWGFSCLIEGKEKTILFDTGTKPKIFRDNLKKLNIDLSKVDLVVISHNHGDHTGGIPVVLEKRKDLPIYVPASIEKDFLSAYPVCKGLSIGVSESIELCDGAVLTGEMGDQIKEHSLIIDTPKGLVVVCGCSHQGITNILDRTKELSDKKIHLVFGGFHLMRHSDKEVSSIINHFKESGVEYCGATHCTGERAIEQFAEAYGDHFVKMGAGRKIVIQ